MSERMDLADTVKFTGRISDEDICRYLSTADLCVDPDPWSEWADHSTMNKIMEYMAFGKPIVAFDLKETRISAQRAAVYVEPNDYKKFSLEIHRLLANSMERKLMGQFGLQRVREKLAWQHTHRALLEVYAIVFARPRVADRVPPEIPTSMAPKVSAPGEHRITHIWKAIRRDEPASVEVPVE